MKILDRYLLREMVVPFLIGQAAIVLMLTGTVLYNNATVLIMNQVQPLYVVRMVLYFIPFLIHVTMPVAMAVAASLAISRLGRDSEITVLRAAGVSLVRIFMPIFLTGLVASVVDFYFGEFIVPLSVSRFEGVVGEMVTHSPQLTPQSGQWIVSNDQSFAFFVKNMVPRAGYIELHGIMVVSSPKAIYNGETAPVVVTATKGNFKDGIWTLDDATTIRYSLEKPDYQVGFTGRFQLNTSVDPQVFKSGFMLQLPMYSLARAATRTFTQIGHEIAKNREMHVNDVNAVLDYHFKLSVPFSCLVMALCCPPLALRFARGGGFMGTLLSICLVFVYWNTLLLMRILGSPGPSGGVPLLAPAIAAWSQNVIFAVIGLFVLYKTE